MKTTLKITNYLLSILFLFTFSCSSDDDNTPEPTVSELLANKWFTEKREDTSTTPSTIEILDVCEQQTYYNFLNDGTLIVKSYYLEADDVCTEQGAYVYTYILSADGQRIVIQEGNLTNTINLVIDTISTTSLTVYEASFPQKKLIFKK
jgi:hypothetical protein